MKKIILGVSAILISITVLLLFTNCKSQISEENPKEEAISSINLGAKVEEDKDIGVEESEFEDADREEAIVEDKNQDSEKQIDTEKENKIPYANDFTLLDLDKNEVSLSDFQGQIVVLNFWATWCPPCRDEIPDFIEVNNLYKDKNVQIIGVSIDTDMKALEDFVEEFGINYPTWIDGTIDKISPIWGVRAIPTTFILTENGEVIYRNVGRMTKEQLIKILEEVL